ncbi:hypothetical protein [Halomarina rubra]|uniref:Uncharacterized protein n=1 Tax=Halomarina rubra TaxID=2071873 RepID=A0ABD6ARF1_9EURY|nr:hypothetical protein [Halomarina rubra]
MNLSRGFEADLEQVLLDEVWEAVDGPDGLAQQIVDRSHEVLRAYGTRHDYDVESVIDSMVGPTVDRHAYVIVARYGWEHPAAPHFAFGSSNHTVDGNPILSFIWEDPPDWIAQEFEQEGDGYRVFLPEVEVSGLPESRFIREGLQWLRREVGR